MSEDLIKGIIIAVILIVTFWGAYRQGNPKLKKEQEKQ